MLDTERTPLSEILLEKGRGPFRLRGREKCLNKGKETTQALKNSRIFLGEVGGGM